MKFQVGDTPVYNWYGNVLIPCEILKCYPNTNRYQIKHAGESVFKEHTARITEKDLYNSQLEFIDANILEIEKQISRLNERKKVLQNKRSVLTGVMPIVV